MFIWLLLTFHPGLQMNSCTTYLNVKRWLDHQTWLQESREPMRLLEVLVKLMKRSWTCLSCQKVKRLSKVEKSQRPEKSAKTIGSEKPSFLTSDTRLAFTKMGFRHTNSRWRTIGHCWKQIGGLTNCKHEVLVPHQSYLWRSIDLQGSSAHQVC